MSTKLWGLSQVRRSAGEYTCWVMPSERSVHVGRAKTQRWAFPGRMLSGSLKEANEALVYRKYLLWTVQCTTAHNKEFQLCLKTYISHHVNKEACAYYWNHTPNSSFPLFFLKVQCVGSNVRSATFVGVFSVLSDPKLRIEAVVCNNMYFFSPPRRVNCTRANVIPQAFKIEIQ